MNAAFDCDVAIVGYGPTGVSAANFLGARGIKCVAFERDRDIYPRARAVTVNDWTLRCYQAVGLLDELLKVMEPMTEMRWRNYGGKELLRSRLPPSEMALPVSCMIYQPAMEQVLRAGAARLSTRSGSWSMCASSAGCVDAAPAVLPFGRIDSLPPAPRNP